MEIRVKGKKVAMQHLILTLVMIVATTKIVVVLVAVAVGVVWMLITPP